MAKEPDDTASDTGPLAVADALKMYETYKSYWAENYREAAIDLKMYLGDAAAHYGEGWDTSYTTPKGAMGVSNELPQYVHQVCNDIRQNVPSLKALPVADADIETGEIIAGLFRSIEDCSHSDEVVDTAAEYAVKCSIGFMMVDHDYFDADSDEQEVVFKTVPDPLSVLLDPASVEYDGRDANGAISLEPINKDDFQRLYKGKDFISFTDPKADKEKTESIVIGQIYVREKLDKRGKKVIIHRYKFSGADQLEYTTFPGDYIPVVPIYGEVTWVDGKRKLSSLIRQARAPQRRLNHMMAKESQVLAQAPISPILAARGQIVNDRGQWQTPGKEVVLEYETKDVDGNPVQAPIRLQPPGASAGFLEAIASAKESIKASMGIYNAGLGKREGDASGIALRQLDKSGDVATFHYPDNVRRSYAHMGEIVIGMMPVVYDTPRIVQTLNDEQDVQMVGINGAPPQQGQKQAYDLTKGKYRVRVTTGASYTTKRQEEADFLQQAFKADPALMQIGGDLLFKSLDTPGAQAMSARMKKMLPPQLQDNAPQQDPQVAQMQQEMQKMQQIIQQGAQEMQSLQTQLKDKSTEYELKSAELLIKDKEANTRARQVELQYGPAADSQQQLLEHALDETAAENQLHRDLFQEAASNIISPAPVMQPQQQGAINGNPNS